MTKTVKKNAVKKERRPLKGAARLLCEKFLGLVSSLPAGAPLPPVNMLKCEYNVGYSVLNRALRELEAEGWICIRKNKGVFAMSGAKSPSKEKDSRRKEAPERMEMIPWAVMERPPLKVGVVGDCAPDFWNRMCDLNNRARPDKKAELVVVPPEVAAESDEPPSELDAMVFLSHFKKGSLFGDSRFMDLRRLEAERPLELELHDNAWIYDRSGRTVDGVAPFLSMTLLACRRDALGKSGRAFGPEPTHADVLRMGGAMKKGFADGRRFVFLGYMSFFFRMGAGFCLKPGKASEFGGAAVDKALDFLFEATARERMSPFCSETYQLYSGGPFPFRKECAMFEAHCANCRDGGALDFFPMPLDGGRHPLFAPVMSVCANSPRPEDAWEFMSFVLSEAGQRLVTERGQGVPAAKDAAMTGPCSEAMLAAVRRGATAYNGFQWLYDSRFMVEALVEKWLRGEAGREETMAEVARRLAIAQKKAGFGDSDIKHKKKETEKNA